ncbi:MAG TPA: glycosyltransferase family 2 protein [Cryomorphaceae bacterium]|nr:glycosyltransferase family 2 protein [Cryomorphaceae bacterium]
MKVSVITISYNAADTLEDTILSVVNQTYDDLEYIVIDGASADGSLEIIEKYRDKIQHFVSEPDEGIYFAMNKGIEMATGDVIAILNADDTYAADDIIEKVVSHLSEAGTDSLYGDLHYVDRLGAGNVVRRWKAGKFVRSFFLKGWMVPHPTFFVKKEVYQKYGLFNTELTASADYEFMVRVLYKEKISTTYLPVVMVNMKKGGQSNLSIQNRIKANKEDRLAWDLNGVKPETFTFIKKPFRKISQFLITKT